MKKIVGYYGSWSVYRPDDGKFDISYIDPKLCTHMVYTFVGLNSDGTIKVLDPWNDLPDNYGKNGFGKFNALKKLNPNVKTMIAIGGWNEGSTKYSELVSSRTLRSKFANNALEFLDKYGFDGFDIDWEYPNQRGGKIEDKKNFILLLEELYKKLNSNGKILSAAVGAAETSAEQSYIISEMHKYLDHINLMTYDFHGSWESKIGINAPLKSAPRDTGSEKKLNSSAAVQYWLKEGAPAKKLILGVPSYGRSFTLSDPNKITPGSPSNGPGQAGPYTREPGMLGYNEICLKLKDQWKTVFDPEYRASYAYSGNQWVGYDDVRSVTEKAEYIKSNALGGAMVWSIETDDFRGTSGEKYPLLKTLNRILR